MVANQTLGGRHLIDTVVDHVREGASVHVTVPASEIDRYDLQGHTPERIAQHRLDRELERLAAAGVTATGNVGPADPMEAIEEQLATGHFTGIIISTLPRPISRWLRMDLPHRVVREFKLPVEWLESHGDNDDPITVHIAVPPDALRNLRRPNVHHHDMDPMVTH
ncbi:MAG: hypothetical protein ACKV2O_23900 [Acidimicrobiales bacterium]